MENESTMIGGICKSTRNGDGVNNRHTRKPIIPPRLSDTAFNINVSFYRIIRRVGWYRTGVRDGNPACARQKGYQQEKDNIRRRIILGTWCFGVLPASWHVRSASSCHLD